MRFKDKVKADGNRRRAFNYLTQQKGLEPHVAAGILGNFMQESGQSLDIEAYNPDDLGKPTYGLAQWRGDRLDRLKKIAGDRSSTLEGQLDFMLWEFNNTEKRAFKKVQEASTTEEAALAFSQYYERPHKDYAHNEKRIKNAKNVYNTFSGKPEEGYDYLNDPDDLYSEENTIVNRSEEYNPMNNMDRPDYNIGVPPQPVQIPFVSQTAEAEDDTEESPLLDAITSIDRRKADMTMIQKLMKANEVQYIDPEDGNQVAQMQDGGETDPSEDEEVTKDIDWFIDMQANPDKSVQEKEAVKGEGHTGMSPFRVKRKGREKLPLNQRVQESTAVRKDTVNPLLETVTFSEDADQTNVYDLANPIVLTYDKSEVAAEKEKERLKEKVNSKSEFLNPMGMEKIDPQQLKSEEQVKALQGQLIENGYDLGEYGADGKLGKETLKAINRFNTKLTLDEELSIGDFKEPEKVRELQEFLINKGYDLNPNNKFADDGVDGKLGEVTKNAVLDYNKKTFGEDSLPYRGVKDGEGLLGLCAEKQCSEYVQNEIWRNVNPDMSRAQWREKTGLHGDAWDIGENIIKAGGRKVAPEGVAAGDVVTIYTGGDSQYQNEADEAGARTSHTGVIDQVNDDGSYYVLHNVHKMNYQTGEFYGREYRDLIKPNAGKGIGVFGDMEVANIYRPKVEGGTKAVKPLRKDVTLTIDPDKTEKINTMDSFIGDASENIETFVKPLNDFKNKRKFSQIFDLDESEYQSLAQLTIGVLGQESNFGTNPKAAVKEPAAKLSWVLNRLTDGNFADSKFMKSDEVSQGAGQLKYNTNFHGDLTEFGITKDNFDEDKNASVTSMYKLATDYKRFLKKGYSKKDALYRAAAVYNASLSGESNGKTREEWAKDYDVDYANKAINLASTLAVQGEDKGYKTMVDELLLEDNVFKWNNKTYEDRNE